MAQHLFRKILVAHDGSEPANRAFERALALAALSKAELHAISVAEDVPRFAAAAGEAESYKHRMEQYFGKLADRLRNEVAQDKVAFHAHIEYGHEVQAITSFVKKNKIDLLVMGAVGHSNVLKHVNGNWGSTAQSLARLTTCTVLVVK